MFSLRICGVMFFYFVFKSVSYFWVSVMLGYLSFEPEGYVTICVNNVACVVCIVIFECQLCWVIFHLNPKVMYVCVWVYEEMRGCQIDNILSNGIMATEKQPNLT